MTRRVTTPMTALISRPDCVKIKQYHLSPFLAFPLGRPVFRPSNQMIIWLAKIREQIKSGRFPIRLKPEERQSGPINWPFDIIAPDRKTAGRVITRLHQVAKEGELRLHPQIAGLLEAELLGKLNTACNGKALQ
jgi:hypothetical protein